MAVVWHGGRMASPSRARGPRKDPLTPSSIVDTALDLTRRSGLDGWTLRDLATALKTWPNAIGYRVGGRDAIHDAVVDRVVSQMTNPPDTLPWQEWFRALLFDGREVIARYPGVARRLCRDGPTVPSALPIMDRGIGLLVSAGFGPDAPLAYATLLNSAVLLIALDDDRAAAQRRGSQAAEDLLAMPSAPDTGDGWATLRPWLQNWVTDPEANRTRLYRFVVDTLIAGLEARLPQRDSTAKRRSPARRG